MKRAPGHRAPDVRDTMAEMAAKAQEISQEAGTRMAAAMKELVSAAAGLAGFAVESARDLVQYMVRRGQMTQEEADKLIREVEGAQPRRKPAPTSAPAPAKKHAPTQPRSTAKNIQDAKKPAAAAKRSAPAKKSATKPAAKANAATRTRAAASKPKKTAKTGKKR